MKLINKKLLAVLASSLLANGAWAGPPGGNTNGSTTTTISASVIGADLCLASAAAGASYIDGGASAKSMALASSALAVTYTGDVTLDLTRHGKNGAVHQLDLTANMGNGTLFVQVATANTLVTSAAEADSSAQAVAASGLIAEALATLFQGINFDIDLIVTDITVVAGSEAEITAIANSRSSAESLATAESEAAASGDGSAEASALAAGVSGSGTSFYVQGANIEEFNTQLNLASAAFVDVQTGVLAQTFANAIATSLVVAIAESSAAAEAESSLSFVYDLPIIGSGSLPIVTDYVSATAAAKKIVEATEKITAQAKALAESSASILASSVVSSNLSVQFENLPGTEDLLEATAVGALVLDCSQVSASAQADAL
jgi:hypothetical protein